MIQVLFFGRIADLMGQRQRTVDELESGANLMAVRDHLFAGLMAGGQITPEALRMSVNQVVVFDDQALNDGDEVAFFSVFSGG